MSEKLKELALFFANHSLAIEAGDKVLIEASDTTAMPLLQAFYEICLERKATPVLDIGSIAVGELRADHGGFAQTLLEHASDSQAALITSFMSSTLQWADKILRIFSLHDPVFLSSVSAEKIAWWNSHFSPCVAEIMNKRWALTFFPTEEEADRIGMSYDELLDEYCTSCLPDYNTLEVNIAAMCQVLDNGEHVRIVGKDTDICFSIPDRLAAGSDGIAKRNVPDGEAFIAPLENSTEGHIAFEWPQIKYGRSVEQIRLVFEKGNVTEMTAESGEDFLRAILDAQPGNRRIGELGIGMNPHITRVHNNPLFDEKIAGTVHIALGRSYRTRRGGGTNDGTIHWDLIKDLRHPGSLIEVDGKAVLRDGEILS